jgi:hypothetical protein
MALYVLALLIGIIAGIRTMTAPAAVSWAAHLGWLPLQNTPLAFLSFVVSPYINHHRARDRRADLRPVAEDTQPEGADSVWSPSRERRFVRSRDWGDGRRSDRRAVGRRQHRLHADR